MQNQHNGGTASTNEPLSLGRLYSIGSVKTALSQLQAAIDDICRQRPIFCSQTASSCPDDEKSVELREVTVRLRKRKQEANVLIRAIFNELKRLSAEVAPQDRPLDCNAGSPSTSGNEVKSLFRVLHEETQRLENAWKDASEGSGFATASGCTEPNEVLLDPSSLSENVKHITLDYAVESNVDQKAAKTSNWDLEQQNGGREAKTDIQITMVDADEELTRPVRTNFLPESPNEAVDARRYSLQSYTASFDAEAIILKCLLALSIALLVMGLSFLVCWLNDSKMY